MSERGKFIALEGGEGSGKTQCLDFLNTCFFKRPVICTREPGGTPYAEAIRSVFKRQWEEGESANSFEELLLVEAARSHHVRQIISPALQMGKDVICDRFAASTYAYQIVAGDHNHEKLLQLFFALEEMSAPGVRPDLWILFDVAPQVALARLPAARIRDRFDGRDISFHEAVRRGLREFLMHSGRKCVVVDASLKRQALNEKVLSIVRSFFG